MPIRMKPKTYGPVFVRAGADGSLRYGDSAGAIVREHPPSGSPAETLLAAIGACMVLSLGIVAARREIALTPFHVAVRATRSGEPPSHLGSFEIRIGGRLVDDPELAHTIARRAKSACTISNSLSGEIALSLER